MDAFVGADALSRTKRTLFIALPRARSLRLINPKQASSLVDFTPGDGLLEALDFKAGVGAKRWWVFAEKGFHGLPRERWLALFGDLKADLVWKTENGWENADESDFR